MNHYTDRSHDKSPKQNNWASLVRAKEGNILKRGVHYFFHNSLKKSKKCVNRFIAFTALRTLLETTGEMNWEVVVDYNMYSSILI